MGIGGLECANYAVAWLWCIIRILLVGCGVSLISLFVIASILSLIFLHKLVGVREGTVAAAIFVGIVAKTVNRKVFHLNS